MRTQQEILDRIDAIKKKDFFGFQRSDLIDFLDYEHAKPFLKDDITADEWENDGREKRTPHEIMTGYMEFAWEKANGKRGISAGRSIAHYQAWLWLDGNDELSKSINGYEYYGKPQLIEICAYLGLDSSKWDDGVRENS